MKNKLYDYLDYHKVRVICTNGEELEGRPINIFYADENESGEDELAVETGNPHRFIGFRESEIARIEVLEE